MWPYLLQGGKGSDIRVRHRPCDGDPKQEASLNITGEIKPWETDSSVSLVSSCSVRKKKKNFVSVGFCSFVFHMLSCSLFVGDTFLHISAVEVTIKFNQFFKGFSAPVVDKAPFMQTQVHVPPSSENAYIYACYVGEGKCLLL